MKNLFPNIEFDFRNLLDEEYSDEENYMVNNSKALFLGHVTHQLVSVCLGLKDETDRDSFIFKRVAVSGFMMGDIFKYFYNLFRNHLRNKIDQFYESGNWGQKQQLRGIINESNMNNVFVSDFITQGMLRSIKGSWGIKREQSGIVQDKPHILHLLYFPHGQSHQSHGPGNQNPSTALVERQSIRYHLSL